MKNNKSTLKILPIKPSTDMQPLKRPINPILPDLSTGQTGLFVGKIKSGKCLYEEEKVETKEGIKKLKEVRIGDYVNSKNGFVKVNKIFNNGKKSCYKVVFKNGKSLIATKDHKIETNEGVINKKLILQ